MIRQDIGLLRGTVLALSLLTLPSVAVLASLGGERPPCPDGSPTPDPFAAR